MNRGNNKAPIFHKNRDFDTFLGFLKETQELYPYDLISYCLMRNHFHLQIRTINDNLSLIMHNLSLKYAKYFNKEYDLVGHLYQGRYVAELIEDDGYLLQTSKYIHLNPVRANIVNNPIEYLWSSYDTYMGKSTSDLLSEDRLLENFFGNDRDRYKKFVERDLNDYSGDEISDVIRAFEDATV